MFRTAFAAAALFFCSLPALAQSVRVTLTDGTVVHGELRGYENGRYKIHVRGDTREVDEARVLDLTLTGAPVPREFRPGVTSTSTAAPDSPAAEVRRAADRGDLDGALQMFGAALAGTEPQKRELGHLDPSVLEALLAHLIDKRDSARLAETVRAMAPLLQPDVRQELFTRMADRFLSFAKGDDGFAASVADAVTRTMEGSAVNEAQRLALLEPFTRLAAKARESKDQRAAAIYYRGCSRLDPSKPEWHRGLAEMSVLHGRTLLAGADSKGAFDAAREAVAADPGFADAQALLEESDLAMVKHDVEQGPADAAELLREFLARAKRPDHRAWAEMQLARFRPSEDPLDPAASVQLRKYFPVRTGRTWLFRRVGSEIFEKVRIDSVAYDQGVATVSCTVKEIYGNWSTPRHHTLEIDKNGVYAPTGSGGREPILKFPAQTGDVWAWAEGGREFRRSVRSLGETVVLGGEERRRIYTDCLVVDFTSKVERGGRVTLLTSRSTYAPGVGLLRLEFLDVEARKYNLELVEQGLE